MASLAPVRPPSATSNRSPTPSSQQHNNVFRHQHSLSSSTPSNQHFGALSPRYGPPRSAGGMRQSLDNTKQSIGNPPVSPRLPPGSAGHNIRPNSEMLGLSGQQQLHGGPSLEAEAIDKWFEDLQSYEATLEEMATASLDASFKEELSAIEQWFRVLSEAERTAALYSLLQSSTQVQIRFFITVLQQMARSDPMTALLSPAPTGNGVSMKQQMEAKLAQLSKMSPASPIVRQFARQSLGPNTSSNEPYLSPNSALLSDSNNFNTSPNDAAALLASQRAKLQSKAANRVSAPGQLLGDSSLKSPKWSNFSGPVEEEAQSRSVSPRPKSTSSELNSTSSNQHNPPAPTLSRTLPSPCSGQESQMSPAVGGSWASQVNTPLVPMFANKDSAHNHHETHQAHGEAVANRLAQWGATHQAGSNSASLPASALAPSKARGSVDAPPTGIQLDDARKFRRASKSNATNASSGFSGVLSGMNSSTNSTSSSAQAPNRSGNNNPANGQSGMLSRTMPATNNTSNAHLTSAMSSSSGPSLPGLMSAQSLLGAPQTAMAAAQQNWRNGLNSPNTQSLNSPDPTMVNNLAMMNTLAGLNGGMDMNSMANLAAMANMTDPNALQNMANILNMRQQIQQVQSIQALQQQLQQNGMIAGMMNAAPLLSPANNGRFGMNMGFPINGGAGAGMAGNKRSPGIGARPAAAANKPNHTPGSGANPEEELDMKLLGDVSAWLRGLRLHKYTPNFEGCTWKEMVMMSDSDLENRGVAAVGARRKMLRTFETVRLKTGMALPGDGDGARDANGDRIESAAGNVDKVEDEDRPTSQHQQPTSNVSVTPESDQ
ncbi:hypothetical protein PGT21_031007 [Puccinia graminis f. sp. tritici]|uniref:RNA-binding protein VTS1 n=1 Tax=Puccinia graminis f. sp. tritici TaxID=56615 RepID=A0A5B0P3Y5_PUCGR|nr:hypothetical protein PGTUg99_014376 [Puccinia graminis f. sp. tritici]KAA1094828.1 hypothetical protein PGT21_031007 [Puccinia graminis f. sp. tritici]